MAIPDAVHVLERELREVFGARLQSLVMYGAHDRGHATHDGHEHAAPPVRTLAIVDTLTKEDLKACANRVSAWHDQGLATPLLFAAREFDRALDVFPLEFGAILADHVAVSGANPFADLAVDPADLRRACEVHARGHLLHLREGYLETRGRSDALSDLIAKSAAPFAALLVSIARLEGHPAPTDAAAARHAERILGAPGAIAEIVQLAGGHDLASTDAERLFGPYLDVVEKLVAYVDGWSSAR
jgi:hypothetical protein